jgi:carboxyl-terminal processing protease
VAAHSFKGVIPDIEFPSIYSAKEYGEEASEFALPYDEIKPQAYSSQGNAKGKLPLLKQKHEDACKLLLLISF